jgi:hypothetical protein
MIVPLLINADDCNARTACPSMHDVPQAQRGTLQDSATTLLVVGQKPSITPVIYRVSLSLCDADRVLAHGARARRRRQCDEGVVTASGQLVSVARRVSLTTPGS